MGSVRREEEEEKRGKKEGVGEKGVKRRERNEDVEEGGERGSFEDMKGMWRDVGED